ncbi:MAG: VOC family protein [Alphaproteobacteria bacterium]
MHMNHMNIPVTDVVAAADFLTTHFAMTLSAPATKKFAMLRDDAGMVLVLSNFEGITESQLPSAFHVGFMMDSRAEVDMVHQKLTAAGYTCDPPRLMHFSWTFYMTAPGGYTLEVQKWEGRPVKPDIAA